MRALIAMAAAALLVTVSAQAAASPVQLSPAGYSASATTADRPQLRERRPRIPAFHATFRGLFHDRLDKRYDVIGDGDFWPIVIGDQSGLKYSVTLTAHPLSFPYTVIEFGQMLGQGTVDDSSTPDHIVFNIHGTTNDRGYYLDVSGVLSDGLIQGDFGVFGNGGNGDGAFAGH